MTLTTEKPISTTADVRPVLNSWRDEFSQANTASLALRLAFPIVACASLLPFVSPGIALMAGIALSLTLGNPYPLTTARVITPLLQISVIGLGAGTLTCCAIGPADAQRIDAITGELSLL